MFMCELNYFYNMLELSMTSVSTVKKLLKYGDSCFEDFCLLMSCAPINHMKSAQTIVHHRSVRRD